MKFDAVTVITIFLCIINCDSKLVHKQSTAGVDQIIEIKPKIYTAINISNNSTTESSSVRSGYIYEYILGRRCSGKLYL